MHRISAAERHARIAVRHHLALAQRGAHPVDAARGVVCLHATDPATVYMSAWARMREPSLEAVERALYEDRGLVRMLAMRRTLFVVPIEEAPVLQAAAALDVARTERRRNEQLVAMLGEADPAGWLRATEAATMEALEELGEATAQELSRVVPALARKVRVNVGKAYEGDIGISSRVLILLALEGRVVRGRPRGSLDQQPVPLGIDGALARPTPSGPGRRGGAGASHRALARALRPRHGGRHPLVDRPDRGGRPGGARRGRRGGGGPRWRGRLRPSGRPGAHRVPEPSVALLPALDPTTMGWQSRDWYLGGHKAQLFDSNGNAGPTIWVDGRIVGGWAIRDGGEVVTGLLESVGREAELAIAAEAARLGTLLAGQRVMPRFPTPHHRALG